MGRVVVQALRGCLLDDSHSELTASVWFPLYVGSHEFVTGLIEGSATILLTCHLLGIYK